MIGRYGGTCESLCDLDVSGMVSWVETIPFDEWPQQDRMRTDYPYPAMVSDRNWHDFGRQADLIIGEILPMFSGLHDDHRMLSIVMPGQSIAEHDDVQSPSWRARIHVPLVTNPDAIMVYGDTKFHMNVGTAYLVNTEVKHSLANFGPRPRIHFFFDLREETDAKA